jgi:hypothetical protein
MTPPPTNPLDDPFVTSRPGLDDLDEEVSKVTNPTQMYSKLEKLDRTLLRLVGPIARIPEIESKVVNVGERVTRVEEQLKSTKERVGELNSESKRPHNCAQADRIERIESQGDAAKQSVEEDSKRLAVIGVDVEEIKGHTKTGKELQRSNHYFWASTLAGFLITVLGSVWYMRGVSAEIETETRVRDLQFQHVEQLLTKVSERSDTAPVVQQIKQLKTSVDQSQERDAGSYEGFCDGLTEETKAQVRRLLVGKQLPLSCGG